MLPERAIQAIMQKFGPRILEYLKQIGYFDLEGSYSPAEVVNAQAMSKYIRAAKSKNTEVWRVVEKVLLLELEGTGAAFIEAYGLKEVVNVKEIATDYIEHRGLEAVKLMTKTDKSKLLNFIWSNSEKNERVLAREILKEPNLSSIVDNSGFRARRIIRTERARGIRSGMQNFANVSGATYKEWRTVGDSRVRNSHRALNGTKIAIDEDFPSEGPYPGAVSVNCRCFLLYSFDKDIVDNPAPSMKTLEDLYA